MRLTLWFLIAAATVIPPLAGTTITFDEIVNSRPNEADNPEARNFQGYRLDVSHYHVVDSPDCDFGGCVAFTGTQYLALDPVRAETDPYWRPNVMIELTREDGAQFGFTGFDASGLFNDEAAARAAGFPPVDSLQIDGWRVGEMMSLMWSLEFRFPPVPEYGRFRVPAGSASVDHVVILEYGGHSWALDNIVVGDAAAVPEPSSMALAALALVGIGWTARLRRR